MSHLSIVCILLSQKFIYILCYRALRSLFIIFLQGRGYSLPADVQYVDARWEVPVVLPLRDCLSQELSMLCHLDRLDIFFFDF